MRGLLSVFLMPGRFSGSTTYSSDGPLISHEKTYYLMSKHPTPPPDPHVTLAYDPSGNSRELEPIYSPFLGNSIPVTVFGIVEGKEGSALLVEAPEELWNQSGLHSPRDPHGHGGTQTHKLGFLANKLQKQATPAVVGIPQIFLDRTLSFYQQLFSILGRLQHHQPCHMSTDEPGQDLWAVSKMEVGLTSVPPVKIDIREGAQMPSIPQYPLKEAADGITHLIESFCKQGILVLCQSPCNTPILPVPKPGRPDWRLVQDLHRINEIVQPTHPVVPNPAMILSSIPPDSQIFTIVDLQHAFFAIPIAPESQYLFAFTFQNQQYTWTRLPQGFVHSPSIFSQILHRQLRDLQFPGGSTATQNVDDLLLASSSETSNVHDNTLLNALHSWAYVIPPQKVKRAQRQVIFLGTLLSATEGSSLLKE
ncbi:uncharacterized protein LOC134357502 [Mobula hypostoma]|uniref:uncharacterized protein LOC134357502 n=1 Tax=Mobula hypostoma TaxID=723540 RepID=UPI002FC2B243